MAILTILEFPNPTLRQKTLNVETFDESLKALIADMFDTMYDAPGVGLAANQVGVLKRLAVIDVDYTIEGDDDGSVRKYVGKNPRVMINPVIVKKIGKVQEKEGCLSVPGYYEPVERLKSVVAEFQDETGEKHTIEADGLLARAIQHEIDHLDGKLFIDRLSEIKKSMIKGKILKRPKEFQRSKFHVEL